MVSQKMAQFLNQVLKRLQKKTDKMRTAIWLDNQCFADCTLQKPIQYALRLYQADSCSVVVLNLCSRLS